MGEPVECLMTVDELLKTDKMFQVKCDFVLPAEQKIPLLPLKGNKLLFPNPVSPTTYILRSPEFLEALKQGYKYQSTQGNSISKEVNNSV